MLFGQLLMSLQPIIFTSCKEHKLLIFSGKAVSIVLHESVELAAMAFSEMMRLRIRQSQMALPGRSLRKANLLSKPILMTSNEQ